MSIEPLPSHMPYTNLEANTINTPIKIDAIQTFREKESVLFIHSKSLRT